MNFNDAYRRKSSLAPLTLPDRFENSELGLWHQLTQALTICFIWISRMHFSRASLMNIIRIMIRCFTHSARMASEAVRNTLARIQNRDLLIYCPIYCSFANAHCSVFASSRLALYGLKWNSFVIVVHSPLAMRIFDLWSNVCGIAVLAQTRNETQ